MFVVAIVVIVLMLVCAFKESSVTATYKANKVYGRLKAYLALDFVAVGIVGILSWFIPQLKDAGFPIFLGPVCLILGILLYVMAYIKCPQPLKKKCIPCMILSGLGVTIKVCVFFLPFIWRMALPDAGVGASGIPETVQDANGHVRRTQRNGDFIDIYRPDGSIASIRSDYVDAKTRSMYVEGMRYHW